MHIVNLVASDNLPSEKVKPIYGTTILPLPASSDIMSPWHFLKSNKWNASLVF